MRYREIVAPDDEADAQLRAALSPTAYADVDRMIGGVTPALRDEIIAVLVREPPAEMTPSEREVMYNPEAEDEKLERDERRAQITKTHAEADRARAEAAAHRAGIRRPS